MPGTASETHWKPDLPGKQGEGRHRSGEPHEGETRERETRERETRECELGDLRFRALIPPREWASLPRQVRHRFSKRLADGRTVVFVGEVVETRMSGAGHLLARAARMIGSPFPTSTDSGVPSVVSITEDFATGGQIWTRLYARRAGFPQVIHSSKRFSGPTGLEEHVGGGVGMTLTLHVEAGALVFRSAGYFVDVLRHRLWLPGALTPGPLTVTHTECGDGRFIFTLDVTHPRFGLLIHQRALFREIEP